MIELEENNLVLNLQSGIFADSKYYIYLNICKSSQCNCGKVTLVLSKSKELQIEKIDCQFTLNIFKNEIIEYTDNDFHSQSKDKKEVRDFFIENLTTRDWKLLRICYFDYKFDIVEQTKIEDINYKFSFEDINDPSLIMQYSNIIDASPFYVELEDSEYLIYDNYCKNYDCNCINVFMEVCRIKNGLIKSENLINIGDMEYDYKKKRVKYDIKDKKEIELVFKEMKEKFDNLENIFEKRHKNVKVLYKKEILNTITKAPKTNNIGRNDPCSCGSGKKYKNCCLNKIN